MIEIENHIIFIKEDDNMVAYITFPLVEKGVVNVNHTFTHPSKRGQGLAKKLMDELYVHLKEKELKVIPSCSYAEMYFRRFDDKQDILLKRTEQ